MILYLDTSALVKLYVEEPGSAEVAARVDDVLIVATSRVAYVEARAGIARKRREGELTREEYDRMIDELEQDWGNYFIVEVSESVTKLGGELTERHPLRGFDAIHLASGRFLNQKTRVDVLFLCFDSRHNEAARTEGLVVQIS